MHRPWRNLGRRAAGLFTATLATALPAQHATPPAAEKPAAPAAAPKRGSALPPTHAPLPVLPPTAALHHVRQNHAAVVAAKQACLPPPPLPERPAGAGRYVCAVIVCADVDLDVPALLGLRRSDVLLVSVPGPFVTPETAALVESQVLQERLSLVLLLAHKACTTLATKPGITPRQDALAQRVETLRQDAVRARLSLEKSLVLAQAQALLSASDELQRCVADDRLRVIPGELDAATGAIQWHASRATEMPLAPVK